MEVAQGIGRRSSDALRTQLNSHASRGRDSENVGRMLDVQVEAGAGTMKHIQHRSGDELSVYGALVAYRGQAVFGQHLGRHFMDAHRPQPLRQKQNILRCLLGLKWAMFF